MLGQLRYPEHTISQWGLPEVSAVASSATTPDVELSIEAQRQRALKGMSLGPDESRNVLKKVPSRSTNTFIKLSPDGGISWGHDLEGSNAYSPASRVVYSVAPADVADFCLAARSARHGAEFKGRPEEVIEKLSVDADKKKENGVLTLTSRVQLYGVRHESRSTRVTD